MVMPNQPRTTLPLVFRSATTFLAMLVGMAKPMPMLPWLGVRMVELMPMASPFMLISGPPELPMLMAASVCRKSSYWARPSWRPLAEMIPEVTVRSWLKGLPMASTHSPTSTLLESPRGMKGTPSALTLSRARSVLGSVPMILAVYSLRSMSKILTLTASWTTWLFVRM